MKDRISGIFGKNKQSSGSERLETSSNYRSVPPLPRLAGSESGSEQRRRRFSRVDDRLNHGMGRLEALGEEGPDGSIADLEPGEIRLLTAPSPSVQNWVDRVPLTEHAVAVLNARPRLGRSRTQSDIPTSSRRMISQERVPESVAPGESAFSTIEPYGQAPRFPLLRAQSAAPTYHAPHVAAQSEAPSYRTVDPKKNIHRSAVKSSEEEKQDFKEQEEFAAAIQESMRDLAMTVPSDSRALEQSGKWSEAQGWDKDELTAAIEQSIRDTGTSQRGDETSSHENTSYLANRKRKEDMAARRREEAEAAFRLRQDAEDADRRRRDAENAARLKLETEIATRTKREAENAIRRVQEAADEARRQRDGEDAARRKRESDETDRRHEAILREAKHAALLEKQEVAEQKHEAEHAARMRELELADKARELARTARARDAESARKVHEEKLASERQIAAERKRIADERSQLEDEKRRLEKVRAEEKYQMGRQSSSSQRASASLAHVEPPPYSPFDGVPSTDRSSYSQHAQPTNATLPSANHTPQVIYTPSAATTYPVTVHSHVTVAQPAPSPQPAPNQPLPPPPSHQWVSQTTQTSSSPGEIYRPPRRIGSIMPDSITRIQQHYRFRRSLIDRNVNEGRRTSEQGQAAIACLNRNEVADIDSEPRRTQELNVIGLEAFEADIELFDRLGGDQMAPPVPWAIPSLEAESRGNYNQAHLREHIERLLAQQDVSLTGSSRMGSVGLGSAGLGHGANTAGRFMPRSSGQYYEWYAEYRF